MNEGVKILIERMKTNPEDFASATSSYGGRFSWINAELQNRIERGGGHPLDMLPQEDVDALLGAYREIRQQDFTDKVIKSLFADEKSLFADEESPLDLPHDPRMPNFSNPPNPAQNMYNPQYWSLQAQQMQQNLAAQQHMGLGQQINGCLTNVSPTATTATTAAALKRTLTGIFR